MLPCPLNSPLCGDGNRERGGLSLKVCRSRDETGLVLLARSHDLYLTTLFFTPSNPWEELGVLALCSLFPFPWFYQYSPCFRTLHAQADYSEWPHIKNNKIWDFPGGPGVNTPCFHWRGLGFNLWFGNYSTCCSVWAKKKKQKTKKDITDHFAWGLLDTPKFCLGFPGGSDKESACNKGDQGLIPELGRFPRGGHGSSGFFIF